MERPPSPSYWVGTATQSVESWLSMQSQHDPISSMTSTRGGGLGCNLRTQEVEAGRSQVQGHLQLRSKCAASLRP